MKISKVILALSAAFSLFLSACEKTDPAPNANDEAVKYALMVTGGAFPNQTAYFSGFKQLPSGVVGTEGAAELTGSGIMHSYKEHQYLTTFGAPATLRKYGFDAQGRPQELGAFVVQSLNTFGAVDFVSDTEAYAASNGFGGVPKLVKFNPTTMQITGTIDLTPIQKRGAKDVFYLGMTHRDDYVFMGVNYQTASFSNLGDSVYVAVINRKTDKVEKLIADGRCGIIWNGGSASSFGPSSIVLDENKDIYITGTGNQAKVPSGVVRIKNGQTTFDPTYFMDLTKTVGSDCQGLFYYGNGRALTLKSEDPANYPFDDSKNAGYRYFKVDLYQKTSQGELSALLPKVSSSAMTSKWDESKLYLSAPTPTTNAMYSLDLSSGTVKKEFDLSAGVSNGFVKFK